MANDDDVLNSVGFTDDSCNNYSYNPDDLTLMEYRILYEKLYAES